MNILVPLGGPLNFRKQLLIIRRLVVSLVIVMLAVIA